jgi:hypothetical protein
MLLAYSGRFDGDFSGQTSSLRTNDDGEIDFFMIFGKGHDEGRFCDEGWEGVSAVRDVNLSLKVFNL